MKRLFIGIPLSEEIKEKIKPLMGKLKQTGADLNFVSEANLHFTLKFLGDVEEKKIDEIKEKLNSIRGKTFLISVKKMGVFPALDRIKVIWLGTDSREMLALMKEVDRKLNYIKENDHPDDIPHLTLARVKSGKNKEELQRRVEKDKNTLFGEMKVDKIILYESELGKEGPVYRVRGEFGLEK